MAVEFLWNAAFWKTSGGIRDLPKEEVVRVLGGSVAAWPLAARAQQPAMQVVGIISGPRLPTIRRTRRSRVCWQCQRGLLTGERPTRA
jgi:hypothetical protein